jgi:NADH:ubiquinone oxidoreductase subunit 6 (subunit J)
MRERCREWAEVVVVTRSDRSYTALMLIGFGLAVGFILDALDAPSVLVIAVVLAFLVGAGIAFRRVRRRIHGHAIS